MKKLLLLVLFIIPFIVTAETCDSSGISIDSIELVSTNGNAEEIKSAINKADKINLDLKLYDPGDSIEYTIKLKNTSSDDFYFDEDSLQLNTDYLEYQFSYDDRTKIIKAGKDKTVNLKVVYSKRVPAEMLKNDLYSDTNNIVVNLSNRKDMDIIKMIQNPETKDIIKICVLVVILSSILLFIVFRMKKPVKYMILIIGLSTIIPITVYALCKTEIEIEAKIQIDGKEAYFLTGQEVNNKIKLLTGNDLDEDDNPSEDGIQVNDESVVFIKNSKEEPNGENKEDKNIVSTGESPYPIYMWFDNDTIYWWSEDITPNVNPDASNMFGKFLKLKKIDGLDMFDVSRVENMRDMFAYDESLNDIYGVENWNMSNVTNMLGMFFKNEVLTDLSPLASWDVSNVTNMQAMFGYNLLLTDLSPLADWNMSNVTNIAVMFRHNESLTNLHGLEKWNVSNVTTFNSLFQYDISLTDISAISNWDVSNVEDMRDLFLGDSSLIDVDLSRWHTPKLIYIVDLFADCVNLTSINISNFDTSNVISMAYAFNSVKVVELDISNFDTRKVKSFKRMFNNSTSLKHIYVGENWDISANIGEEKSVFPKNSQLPNFDPSNPNRQNLSNAHTGEGGYLTLKLKSLQ